MKTFTVVIGAVLLMVFLVGGISFMSYINWTNEANRTENGIKAQGDVIRNAYDQGYKKVVEVAQVPDMQMAKMKDVIVSAIQGRFGQGGSQALFQGFKEAEINIDQSTFVRIQQVVEEFHNKVENRQNELIVRKNAYNDMLTGTLDGRIFGSLGGYPRIDLSKYDIITSDKTEKAWETKRDEPLDLLNKVK